MSEADPGERMRLELAANLRDLESWTMPFGRFSGQLIHTLPYEYLHWFVEKADGFPGGRLGELMEFVYHTKANGSEIIFRNLPGYREP
ncbi:MAG: DUF3820 family protein [Verrucomicrobiota bacterium]